MDTRWFVMTGGYHNQEENREHAQVTVEFRDSPLIESVNALPTSARISHISAPLRYIKNASMGLIKAITLGFMKGSVRGIYGLWRYLESHPTSKLGDGLETRGIRAL